MTTRGTTNANERGNTEMRRRRREWLVKTFRANEDLCLITDKVSDRAWLRPNSHPESLVRIQESWGREVEVQPACRCYRCGTLLTVDTVTVDRIVPGCKGGTYARNNIRPACGPCNSETGGGLRANPTPTKKARPC